MKKILFKCAHCQKDVYRFLSRIKLGRKVYCSMKCYSDSAEHIVIACKGCSKDIKVLKKSLDLGSCKTYCSRECFRKHNNYTRPCAVCCNDFTTWKSKSWIKTCSRTCAGVLTQKHKIVSYNGIKYYKTTHGYYVSRPKGKHGTMLHRKVYEDSYNVTLKPYNTIHHINGNRADNRIENLELWTLGHPHGIRVKDLKD